MKSQFASIRALFATDAIAEMPYEKFDDELWFLLCNRVSSPSDLESLPAPVQHYFASRLLEWDVGNGGFAQAAYNSANWFPLAAAGYEALGLPRSAALIRDAIRWLPSERREIEKKGLFAATIGQVFDHFRDSKMEMFNDRIVSAEWYVDELRVKYARANRDSFCSVE
jgi:hypothetical protein